MILSCIDVMKPMLPTSFPESSPYFENGCSCVYACQPKPHNLILSTLSREMNVALLYGRYFEKEASYLSQFLPGQLLRIERELCFYFTAFLNNRQQPASN